MDKLDEDMKNLFISVGISNNDQVDKETIDFIYDFVEKNGGIEQVKKEMLSRPPPPPPPSGTLHLSKTPLTLTPAFMIGCWGLRVRAYTILKTKKTLNFHVFNEVCTLTLLPHQGQIIKAGGVRVRGVSVYSGTCLFAEDSFILNHICAMPVKIKTEINIFVDWNRDMAHKKEITYL